MAQTIEPLDDADAERIAKHRAWVAGHFDDPAAYESVANKLKVIQTVLDSAWVEKHETWKLQSLGVAFGDALVQEVPELFWVAVNDEWGRDPALRWLNTTTLAFPLTAISKRVERNEKVDVQDLFLGFQRTIREAVEKS